MTSWRPARRRTALDLTPLIDVVFTLLLFVVVTAHFTNEGSLPLALPQARASLQAPSDPLIVSLTKDGKAYVGGVFAPRDVGQEAARQVDGTGKAVVLRADGSASYESVFGLLQSLRDAGISDIGLAHDTQF